MKKPDPKDDLITGQPLPLPRKWAPRWFCDVCERMLPDSGECKACAREAKT